MADPKQAPSDEAILREPGEYTAEQVTDALGRAPASRVGQVKAAETAAKNRKAIVEWEAPALGEAGASSADDNVERYTVAGWRERARQFKVDGRAANKHAVAGALHDAGPDELFSQAQVQQRVQRFLTAPEDELP